MVCVKKLQNLIILIEDGTGISKCVNVFTAGFTDAAKEEAGSRSSSMTLSLVYTFGLVSPAKHCRQAHPIAVIDTIVVEAHLRLM